MYFICFPYSGRSWQLKHDSCFYDIGHSMRLVKIRERSLEKIDITVVLMR